MGHFFSRFTTHSIDVTGDHNFLVVVNGVPLNCSEIFRYTIEKMMNDYEKRFFQMVFITTIVLMVLLSALVMIFSSCLMRRHRKSMEKEIFKSLEKHLYVSFPTDICVNVKEVK